MEHEAITGNYREENDGVSANASVDAKLLGDRVVASLICVWFACKLSGGTVQKIDIQGVCPGMSGLISVNAVPMIECQWQYGKIDAWEM